MPGAMNTIKNNNCNSRYNIKGLEGYKKQNNEKRQQSKFSLEQTRWWIEKTQLPNRDVRHSRKIPSEHLERQIEKIAL